MRGKVIAAVLSMAAICALVSAAVLGKTPLAGEAADNAECTQENLHCALEKIAPGTEALRALPEIEVSQADPVAPRDVTYSVETRGAVKASLDDFKQQSKQTLNHPKGWSRLGVRFREVASSGDFTLVLAEAQQVARFSVGCDQFYSCNAGRYVIINQDRWLGATTPWNRANGSLRDYRHMVVGHEVGHWLGHDHRMCSALGKPAALMQQQSVALDGCTFNPWPLERELYSPKLGVSR